MIINNEQEFFENLNRLKEKNTNPRPCEICNKSDLPTFVTSSGLGPMSYNICVCCSAMGAEMSGFEDLFGDYMTYNCKEDNYVVKDTECAIQLRDGKSFDTRSEFVKYFETKKEIKYTSAQLD